MQEGRGLGQILIKILILMFKLLCASVHGKLYVAIEYLNTLEACVKLKNDLESECFQTLYGIRQEDSISPTLISVYLNDLAKEIKKV